MFAPVPRMISPFAANVNLLTRLLPTPPPVSTYSLVAIWRLAEGLNDMSVLLVIVVMFAEDTFTLVIVVSVIEVMLAELELIDTMFALVILANEAFRIPNVPVPTVSVVMVCVPTKSVVRFATEAFSVAINEFEILTLEAFKRPTFAFVVVSNVATIALCCEVPVTESVVIFANEAFKTGTVSSDTDNVVIDTVPMFALWIFAEKMFARSLTCSNTEMFAFAVWCSVPQRSVIVAATMLAVVMFAVEVFERPTVWLVIFAWEVFRMLMLPVLMSAVFPTLIPTPWLVNVHEELV